MNQLPGHSYWRNSILRAVIIFLLFSCKERIPDPYFSNGAIYGRIQYSEYHEPGASDIIKITAVGPYGSKSTLAGVDGAYKIQGLGNGTYEVTIENAGYGTTRFFGVQVFGMDSVRLNALLYRVFVSSRAPRLYSPENDEDSVNILFYSNYNITEPFPKFGFFISEEAVVDFNHFDFLMHGEPDYTYSQVAYYATYIDNKRLSSGKKYFMKGYPINPLDPGYWNPYIGRWEYPSMNYKEGTATISFIAP